MSNGHIQMLRESIMDVVVVAGCLNCGFCSSILLGEFVEVRVLDANLFNDFPSFIYYCHLCVPFVDIDSEVHGLFLRDAGA